MPAKRFGVGEDPSACSGVAVGGAAVAVEVGVSNRPRISFMDCWGRTPLP